MKKLHLLLAIITLFITQCALSAPVVEFYNKQQGSPDFVRLMIKNINTDKQVANPYVKRNAQWRSEEGTININDKLEVEVWTEAGKAVKFIVDAPGKTKYLSWNPEKSMPLYPQTGPLMGFMGKTESGLPLDNNLKASQIKLVGSGSPFQTSTSTQPKPNIIPTLQQGYAIVKDVLSGQPKSATDSTQPKSNIITTPQQGYAIVKDVLSGQPKSATEFSIENTSNNPIGCYVVSEAGFSKTVIDAKNKKKLYNISQLEEADEIYVCIITNFQGWPGDIRKGMILDTDEQHDMILKMGKSFKIDNPHNTNIDLKWDPNKIPLLSPKNISNNIHNSDIQAVNYFAF